MKLDRDRIRATLGRPELARLVQRLRLRLERGQPLTGSLTLAALTLIERDALDRLLGRTPTSGHSAAVPLERLAEKLRMAGVCPDLRAAVEELTGPVPDRRLQRQAIDAQWNDLFAAASLRIAARPALQTWLVQLQSTGLLRRYEFPDAAQLLGQALDVVLALPTSDAALAELAAATVGDAHALDPGTSLGSIVLRAVALLGQRPKYDDAHSRRDAWASVGVICDEVSAPVLLLNLTAADTSPTSQALRIYADAGEPTFLTIRQLLRSSLCFDPAQTGRAVYVCENPNIVAAAARRLGSDSAPLVCIEGQPRTATRLLLNRLRAAGVALRYHGDFDWPGIQIANTIIERHQALPWRMGVDDYRIAATGPLPLSGIPVAARWDSALMPVMRENGRAAHEEQVAELLLADLSGDR